MINNLDPITKVINNLGEICSWLEQAREFRRIDMINNLDPITKVINNLGERYEKSVLANQTTLCTGSSVTVLVLL